ncbi:GNAT family N-acetyltransferase [Kocuria palustris]
MTTSETAIRVRPASAEDLETIAGVMALAFTDDPWARAHAAPGEDLTKRLEAHYRLLLEQVWLPHAAVDVAELHGDQGPQILGAAVWDRPESKAHEDPAAREAERRAGEILGTDPQKQQQDSRTYDRLHPQEPHWRLSYLTVAPAAQGRRVGSTLLEHGLARAEGLPVGLESTTPGSRRLYERSGFELVELITDSAGVEQTVMRRG